tara:strand:+ start:422 stop:619 length:198 start_codon:yes stop_codon:yes gene_type:complete
MRNLQAVLDYLKNELNYEHDHLLAFVLDTNEEIINGVSYVSGENIALPHNDYMKLSANVPQTITQ